MLNLTVNRLTIATCLLMFAVTASAQKGVSITDPSSGLQRIQITEFSDINHRIGEPENQNTNITWALGDAGHGMSAGYAGYDLWGKGNYYLAYQSQPFVNVYRKNDWAYVQTVPVTRYNAVQDVWSVRWDKRAGHENMILWAAEGSTNVSTQDVSAGSSSIRTLGTTPDPIKRNGDETDTDDLGRYLALKTVANGIVTCGVFDLFINQWRPIAVNADPNAITISPDGRWFGVINHTIVNDLYSITGGTAQHIGCVNMGHNGWTGASKFVYQDNTDDWIKMYDPVTQVTTNIVWLKDFSYPNQHLLRMPIAGASAGWIFMALYGSDLAWKTSKYVDKEEKLYAVFAINLVTKEVRYVTQTNCKRVTNQNDEAYFTEGHTSFDSSGRLFITGNGNGTRNLNVDMLMIPDSWWGQPTVPGTPTPIYVHRKGFAILARYRYKTTDEPRLVLRANNVPYGTQTEAQTAASTLPTTYSSIEIIEYY